MATAEQIINLVKAFSEQDTEKFKTITLQVAAHEARMGHNVIARQLKKYVDEIPSKSSKIIRMNNNDNSMLNCTYPENDIRELIVSSEVEVKIVRILNEFKNRNKLSKYGFSNRRKVLLEGAPGTGKTMTASVIASKLNLPLYTVQVDKLVTKFMGETSIRLRQIFESIQTYQGVYLFDEFDAIAAERGLDNEVGEMRRILNALLQFIEQDSSESLIFAATNNMQILDKALFRRFDDVIHYRYPDNECIKKLMDLKIHTYDESFIISNDILNEAAGLSHAEIVRACDDAMKLAILGDGDLSKDVLLNNLAERKGVYSCKEA